MLHIKYDLRGLAISWENPSDISFSADNYKYREFLRPGIMNCRDVSTHVGKHGRKTTRQPPKVIAPCGFSEEDITSTEC